MIGVPLTAGFISKWYLVLAAIESGRAWIAVALLLSSLLAVIYIWRVVEVAYFQKPSGHPDSGTPKGEAPWQMLVPTWVMIGATLYFGIHTDLTVGVAKQAVSQLLGGVP
jgi:multicomponent Na+:H+ antiporter subunit D